MKRFWCRIFGHLWSMWAYWPDGFSDAGTVPEVKINMVCIRCKAEKEITQAQAGKEK